jgi:hypothetical protein
MNMESGLPRSQLPDFRRTWRWLCSTMTWMVRAVRPPRPQRSKQNCDGG